MVSLLRLASSHSYSTRCARRVGDDPDWVDRFHAGERAVIESVYLEQFETVSQAVARVLSGADRETVVHDVFLRLLSSRTTRESFQGGNLGAWLATVARHQAIDVVRRNQFEQIGMESDTPAPDGWEAGLEARLLIERFRRDSLPPSGPRFSMPGFCGAWIKRKLPWSWGWPAPRWLIKNTVCDGF